MKLSRALEHPAPPSASTSREMTPSVWPVHVCWCSRSEASAPSCCQHLTVSSTEPVSRLPLTWFQTTAHSASSCALAVLLPSVSRMLAALWGVGVCAPAAGALTAGPDSRRAWASCCWPKGYEISC